METSAELTQMLECADDGIEKLLKEESMWS